VNTEAMRAALQTHPEVLAEAIQTVLRREGVEIPYEKLKNLTRGKQVALEDFVTFIDGLDIGADVKKTSQAIAPRKLHRTGGRNRQGEN
jgi:Adenylosuccinate lyase C-terminal.